MQLRVLYVRLASTVSVEKSGSAAAPNGRFLHGWAGVLQGWRSHRTGRLSEAV